MGVEAASKAGISQWANIHTKNSERDTHRVVGKQGTCLKIPISEIQVQGETLSWISPRDWLRYIVNHGLLYMLSGLHYEEKHLVGAVWKDFWTKYEPLNSDHGFFYKPDANYERTIGLFIHGDEGRTLKRGGLMVTSIQSILGVGFDRKRLKRPRGANDIGKLQVNFASHTFLTRFVVSVIPKTSYQSNPDYFHDTMDKLAIDLLDLLETGITDRSTGDVWKFCIIGVKGDMPYLQKIGKLRRSWNTTVKRGQQRTEPRGVCHLCLAGTNQYPAEDTSSGAGWIATIGVQVPWDVEPGIIKYLPHDQSHPASFLQADLWHCIHLGIGKSFVSSAIQIALEVVPASNNDERFQWLSAHYHRWCRSVKRSSYVSKINAYLVSYGDGPGATGNWSKGSLTSNLARWLNQLLGDLPDDQHRFLSRCREAVRQLNAALSFLYNAPLFLEYTECKYVVDRGNFFLQCYTRLASECYRLGRPHLFPLFPKIHAVKHCWLTLDNQSNSHGYGLNPLTASCQMDEDTIGRVARVSRRVSIRVVVKRTLQRHLVACWNVWTKAGVLR